jgi:hypothetical protein
MKRRPFKFACSAAIVLALLAGTPINSQLSVRPDDPSGLALRMTRVRIVHSDQPRIPGTSMHLQQTDPWLAYAIGQSYFEREWTLKDGLFQFAQTDPLAEGATNSCGMCHNLPFRTAGYGGNVATPGAYGRNVPHLFGIGLVEEIGIQIRSQILSAYDTNHNGFLDVPSEVRGKRAVIEAAPGVKVDFGSLEDLAGDGWPGLNDVIRVVMVDRQGRRLTVRPDGKPYTLLDPEVAGYDPVVAVITSSTVVNQQASIRGFVVGVIGAILGLPIRDPSVADDARVGPEKTVWAGTSNAGAQQLRIPVPFKQGTDPCQYVSEGEIDTLEWFLLNHPRPGLARQNSKTRRGQQFLRSYGCTSCHIQDWAIKPADDRLGLPGDRRFFDFDVSADNPRGRLEGRLRMLTREQQLPDGARVEIPRRGGFTVRNIYSDLRYHDLGERFYEYRSVGGKIFVTKRFRSAPLWGVGSSAPYGHDGRSATLDDVIRRHGGEAAGPARAYEEASWANRNAVLAFLKSLVLYQTDIIPADLDGDGRAEDSFLVDGREVGPERLRPEFLFRMAPRYRGWVDGPDGDRYFSYELLNANDVYGRNLVALRDTSGAGIPDIDPCRPSIAAVPRGSETGGPN